MAKHKFGAGITASGRLNDATQLLNQMETNKEYNFEFIPKEKIQRNKLNSQYSQDDIEWLKNSIIVNGLRHNLSVIHDLDNDVYRIISGERRYHAISEMNEEDYKRLFPKGIPCKIEKGGIDEVDEEIMLISANHDVRETSTDVKRWEILRLKELYAKKNGSEKIKGISSKIAEHLDISARMVRRYLSTETLIPELSDMLNEGNIKLVDAEGIAKLSEDAQKQVVELIKQNNGTVNEEELKEIKKRYNEREKELEEVSKSLEYATADSKQKQKMIEYLEGKIEELEAKETENKRVADNHTDNTDNDELIEELELAKSTKAKLEKDVELYKKQVEELKAKKKAAELPLDSIQYEKVRKASEIAALIDTIEKNVKALAVRKKDLSTADMAKLKLIEEKIKNI